MLKAVHMCIRTNEEQDNNIAYNDPASEVWRERYKQISETIYPIIETSIPKAISGKITFYLRVN